MNPLLHRLTGSLPASAPTELRREWTSFVVHQNVCAVPAPDLPMGSAYWQRGCLLLLLDDRGRPTHLAKLRPIGEPNTAYEGEVLRRLWTVPEIRPHIPAAHWTSADGAQLLLTSYSAGEPYRRRVGRVSDAAWVRDMHELLAITQMISDRAPASGAELRSPETPFHFADEAAALLGSVAALGLHAEELEVLTALLRRSGSAPRSPQHGDLWPGNILRDGRRWRLLDFEMFGKVQAPLFDHVHLLRTSLIARAGSTAEAWLTAAELGSPQAASALSVLAAVSRRNGFDLAQAMGCIVYYLTTMADHFRGAELPGAMADPILLDLRTIIAATRDGNLAPRCLQSRF